VRILGVDPGTHTGVALWDAAAQKFELVECMAIHRALEYVGDLERSAAFKLPVIFEDARQRNWFGHSGRERLQGAGYAKRDAVIWEDFLTDLGCPYLARKPSSGSTGWDQGKFRQLTRWDAKTNEHARDAGVLVYGFKVHEIPSVVRSWEQLRANQATRTQARRK
jgi:hypothetical protein